MRSLHWACGSNLSRNHTGVSPVEDVTFVLRLTQSWLAVLAMGLHGVGGGLVFKPQ